jgi:hypothetical protein
VVVKVCPCKVGDVRESGDLEVLSASIEPFKIGKRVAVFSEGVHDINIILAVGLWFGDSCEFDFGLDCFQEPSDARHPSVLNVI